MATAAAAARKPEVKEFNFSWVGQDKSGKTVRGDIRATGEAQVNATLRRQGIKVVGIKKQRLTGGRITEKDITLFTRQLATMMKSGVPLLKNIPVLGHLAKNTTQSKIKTQRLFVLSPRIVSLDSLLETQGAGLEPVFDRSRRVDWAQRAFGDPNEPSDTPEEKREKKQQSTDGH